MSEDSMEDVVAAALKDAAGGIGEVSDAGLNLVSTLVQNQMNLEAEIGQLEEKLTLKKDALRKISEYDLPNAIIEMGMRSVTMLDGSKVQVDKVYAASIRVDNRQAAFKWMRDAGHEALIKAEIAVAFPKGDVETAEKLKVAIEAAIKKRGLNIPVALEQSVHWQTLRAFVKEQIETEERLRNEGRSEEAQEYAIPRELLGVHIIDKAKIIPPKKEK